MVQWASTAVYPFQSRQDDGCGWKNVPAALETSELPSSSNIAPFLPFFCFCVSLAVVHRPRAFFFQPDTTFWEFAETSALLCFLPSPTQVKAGPKRAAGLVWWQHSL